MFFEEKPKGVVASEHAIDRWCERMRPDLDATNKGDRQIAAQEMLDAFYHLSKFEELQDSGRMLFVYTISKVLYGRKVVEDISMIVEYDGSNIVTCWSNERMEDEKVRMHEIDAWRMQQKRRTLERLFAS